MAAQKKGREKRAGKTDDEGTGLVRVRLSDDQVRERADSLASLIKKKEDIEGRKHAAAAKFNGELKLLEEKISQLADEVDTREANVEAQTAMNFGGPAGRRQPRPEAGQPEPANEASPAVEGAA